MPKVQLWRHEDPEQRAVGFRSVVKAKCWSYFILRRYYLLSLGKWKGCLLVEGGSLAGPLPKGGLCGRQGGSCRLPAGSGAFVLHVPSWRRSLRLDQSIFGGWLGGILLLWSPLVFRVCETVWTWSCSHTELGLGTLGMCSYCSRDSAPFTRPTRHRTAQRCVCFPSKPLKKENS